MTYLLLLVSFAVILAGALAFTNAIEWIGYKLGLGEGAVGSLLAAVGTAMPETLIPVVAIIGGSVGSESVAVGAIVGAPFLLATVAMALVGVSALAYRNKRPQGVKIKADIETLDRDLLVFLAAFGIALLVGVLPLPRLAVIVTGCVMLVGYLVYVKATLSGGGDSAESEELEPLIMDRRANRENVDPPNGLIILQLLVGLGAMIGGAHLFVEELISVAGQLGVPALVLSLVLAPLATELPEKINSYFWVKRGKDSLAMGNITGAMVFQSMVPVFLGMVFIGWSLDMFASLSMILGLLGGGIAYWALRIKGEFNRVAICLWASLYLVFIASVIII